MISQNQNEEKKYSIQSVQRAFLILRALSLHKEPVSLSQLSREVGLHKSVCHRLLMTLSYDGIVESVAEGTGYRIGVELYRIGQAAVTHMDLSTVAAPIIERLMNTCGESVYLSVESDGMRVCVARAESPHVIRHYISLGEVLPLIAGAGGKVLLAAKGKQDLDNYLETHELVAFGPKSIQSIQDLLIELERIRNDGFAWSSQERTEDATSVSAPVRDRSGFVVASLTIAGPSSRLGTAINIGLANMVIREANEISMKMGYDPKNR